MSKNFNIAVVGLGYVGLPLAVHLSKHFNVVGFDISERKIDQLKHNIDMTNEVGAQGLKDSNVKYTSDGSQLADRDIIIVAVPTPVDHYNNPNLAPVIGASRTIAKHMKKGCIVVYESTVYPGVTEDICIPELEKESGYKFGQDFKVGYSPERINPGDKVHTLVTVKKVVSGSDEETLETLAYVYGKVVEAGIHKASCIKVAEAAKIIENTQRDINIAFVNELSVLFNKLGIDTKEVLAAAGSKWNFLPFQPGLVGGHCIGVDPYYLVHKAKDVGMYPRIIAAGRRINDEMGSYIADQCIKSIAKHGKKIVGARIGIMGITFKENVPDIRNSKVLDIINELKKYNVEIFVQDPHADPEEVAQEYGIHLVAEEELKNLDVLIVAIAHSAYKAKNVDQLEALFVDKPIILDIKGFLKDNSIFNPEWVYWTL